MLQIFKTKDPGTQAKKAKEELKVALKKAKQDAQNLKELQETNEVLLQKYQQNEIIL